MEKQERIYDAITLAMEYQYTAAGKLTRKKLPDGQILQFHYHENGDANGNLPGQCFDAETGTHYNYFRDYDPKTGRYLTPDPTGLNGGINGYAYAAGNPVGFVDLLGLKPLAEEQSDG